MTEKATKISLAEPSVSAQPALLAPAAPEAWGRLYHSEPRTKVFKLSWDIHTSASISQTTSNEGTKLVSTGNTQRYFHPQKTDRGFIHCDVTLCFAGGM